MMMRNSVSKSWRRRRRGLVIKMEYPRCHRRCGESLLFDFPSLTGLNAYVLKDLKILGSYDSVERFCAATQPIDMMLLIIFFSKLKTKELADDVVSHFWLPILTGLNAYHLKGMNRLTRVKQKAFHCQSYMYMYSFVKLHGIHLFRLGFFCIITGSWILFLLI